MNHKYTLTDTVFGQKMILKKMKKFFYFFDPLFNFFSIDVKISELHNAGKKMLMVTSGAVAFGKFKIWHFCLFSHTCKSTLILRKTKVKAISAYVTKLKTSSRWSKAYFDGNLLFNNFSNNAQLQFQMCMSHHIRWLTQEPALRRDRVVLWVYIVQCSRSTI